MTVFFRLLPHEDKGAVLAEAVAGLRDGRGMASVIHEVDPASFSQIPGSPFAYWVSERVRRLFTELPPFEGEGRTVRQGLATADDFRYVRAWWEVPPEKIVTGTPATTPEEFRQQTFQGKRWVSFAKGGAYSPYYADLHLVVNWERNGEEMKSWVETLHETTHWSRRIPSVEFYFRPGLTYPRRLHKIAVIPLPSGSIISVRGSGIYSTEAPLANIAGLFSSTPFDFLVKTMLGRYAHPQFDNGTLCRTPIPPNFSDNHSLTVPALASISLQLILDTANEGGHTFCCPALLKVVGDSLADRLNVWNNRVKDVQDRLARHQKETDEIAFRLYGIDGEDRQNIEDSLRLESQLTDSEPENEHELPDEAEEKDSEPSERATDLVADMMFYAIGSALRRWDIRLATGERGAPELPDPFAPLPVCSPGMLTGPDGLPAREAPPGYPLRLDFTGILVDDPGPDGTSLHQDDIVRRVREVFELIWRDRAEAIEREACEILGVGDLREYFRNPRGFFDFHIKRYSKSRRKAPIYWLLQSSRRSYGLWIYYHRLNRDTLFKAVQHYVEPKIQGELHRLREMTARLAEGKNGLSRGERTRLEKAIDRQQDLLSELGAFKQALERVIALQYDPDLNDGVILNIAPLHEVVPWREARKYWDDLCAGKYPWSTMAQRLRDRGAVRA